MKKNELSLMFLPLLLASCVVGTDREETCSASIGTSEPLVSSSFDFGSEPTSLYQKEDASFINGLDRVPYRVRLLRENGDRILFGPTIGFTFGDSWVDVELVGQKDITAGVKGLSSLVLGHAYGDYSNDIYLDGRKFPGVNGEGYIYAYIPENACRNPDECFIRLISHPKTTSM